MASKNKQTLSKVTALSDTVLLSRFKSLLRTSNRQLAEVLEHLAEVDTRKLYRGQGYSSMFTYCTERLHLSEGAAYKRIKAARLIRRFPALLERIASGKLHLSAVVVLGPVLTDDNHVVVMDEAAHKSRRRVEELVARYVPKTVVRPHFRRLPNRNPSPPEALDGSTTASANASATESPTQGAGSQSPSGSDTAAPAARRINESISPLDGEQFRLHVTVSGELRDKLAKAQQLSKPGSTMAQVIEGALDALIDKLMRRRFAATQRPRTATPRASKSASRRTRHVPAPIRREVVERDGLQCSFVAADGHRCTERSGLELHHQQPFASGGEHTADNISLMCRAHNGYLAERDYGPEHMQRCVGGATGTTSTTQSPTAECRPGTAGRSTTEARPASGSRPGTAGRSTTEARPACESRPALEQPCAVTAQGANGSCSSGEPNQDRHASRSAAERETCTAPTAAAGVSPSGPSE